MFNREKQVEWLRGAMDRPPLIVAPYDAELFGHWWFEGPDWINFLLRKMHWDQQTIKTITVPEYLDRHPQAAGRAAVVFELGPQGLLRGLARRLQRLDLSAICTRTPIAWWNWPSNHADGGNPLRRRALNQAARELLLAQSSDWAFIMKTGTMVEYACERTQVHVLNFNHLYEQIKSNDIDETWLNQIEARHNLFPDIDYRVYG